MLSDRIESKENNLTKEEKIKIVTKNYIEIALDFVKNRLGDEHLVWKYETISDEAIRAVIDACESSKNLKLSSESLSQKFLDLYFELESEEISKQTLIWVLQCSIALSDPKKNKTQLLISYANLFMLHGHNYLSQYRNTQEIESDSEEDISFYQIAKQLYDIKEVKLAGQCYEFAYQFDIEDKNYVLPKLAELKEWDFVKQILDTHGNEIDVNFPRKGESRHRHWTLKDPEFNAIYYSIDAKNKPITKYLLLLGAKPDLDYLREKETTFWRECANEVDDFLQIAANIIMNSKTCVTFFQNPRGFSDDLSDIIRKNILLLGGDPDLVTIPENILFAAVQKHISADVTISKSTKTTALLAVREFRQHNNSRMTQAETKEKRDLLGHVLHEHFGHDEIDSLNRESIRHTVGFLAEKNLPLNVQNFKLLMTQMNITIKNLIEKAIEISQNKGILNKRLHFLHRTIFQLFSKKEYAGLWTKENIINHCAEQLAESLKKNATLKDIYVSLEALLKNESIQQLTQDAAQFSRKLL